MSLAITGAIRGTSEEKLYQKLGLESLLVEDGLGACSMCLQINHYAKACVSFKLDKNSVMCCRNDYFKNSFMSFVVRALNKLNTETRNSTLTTVISDTVGMLFIKR